MQTRNSRAFQYQPWPRRSVLLAFRACLRAIHIHSSVECSGEKRLKVDLNGRHRVRKVEAQQHFRVDGSEGSKTELQKCHVPCTVVAEEGGKEVNNNNGRVSDCDREKPRAGH